LGLRGEGRSEKQGEEQGEEQAGAHGHFYHVREMLTVGFGS
jgi:hypothetical protein